MAVIDPWTGGIWFTIGLLVVIGLFAAAWWALRGRWRWLLALPAIVTAFVVWVAFDSLVLAPVRWQSDGVCSGWWQGVPTYLDDGTENRTPEVCVGP